MCSPLQGTSHRARAWKAPSILTPGWAHSSAESGAVAGYAGTIAATHTHIHTHWIIEEVLSLATDDLHAGETISMGGLYKSMGLTHSCLP